MLSRYEQFSFVISSIYHSIQRIERSEMIKYGFKGSFAQYLAALTRYPEGLTLPEICELCEKDKAAVSRALSDMEAQGLVCRITAEGRDSRYRARICLTEEGQKISNVVCQRAREVVGDVSDLNDEQRASFYEALGSIATRLERVNREHDSGEK